jgi:hypothetical protein
MSINRYILSKEERKAIYKKYKQNPDNSKSYKNFRQRVYYDSLNGCLILKWCDMWVGIERDGYTHT